MFGKLVDNLGMALMGRNSTNNVLVSLVSYVIVLVLLLTLGEYLWNNVLVKLISVVKPVKSIWELLALQILLSLLLC